MSTHQNVSEGQNSDRFARLNALYEQYCQQGVAAHEANEDLRPEVVELPCEYAPSVRRRTAVRKTH